ncbi:hypothetical protein [Aureimonas sp. SK2]|uniref:hypothetical protein n=1 Tax=Aureimonas sp. SK2 TaxID=3015992 RepID=UPI00244472F5|nr:hypothetical protein [Aureimonas sp. SK2]
MTLLENPSPLELGLETADDSYGRLAPQLQRITAIGRTDTPADWLPYVLENKGLEAIVPYVRDMAKALREGKYWLKKRGTETAIEIGIGWVNSSGTVAPADGRHHWYRFQVAYPDPPQDLQQIRQLVGITNLSKSSWDELFRLYSPDYDHRPVRMDEHRYDDGGWMDDYSGAPRWEGGPYLSFGRDGGSVVDLDPHASSGGVFEGASLVSRDDEGMRYDEARFGERPRTACGSVGETDGTFTGAFDADTWPDQIADRPWSEMTGPTSFSGPYRVNDGSAVAAFTEDTWPDVVPANGSWQDAAAGPQAFSSAQESP